MNALTTGFALTPQQAEARRDKLAKILFWGGIAGIGIVAAPLIFTLLKVTVAAIVAALLGAAAVAFGPVVTMKLANWKLKAIIEEARQNPIPTLENELITRKDALSVAAEQLKVGLGSANTFIELARKSAEKNPQLAARWQQRVQMAEGLKESKKRAFARAEEAVNAFEGEVETARTEWALIVAEAAMNKSLKVIAGDGLAQLKTRTALDSVTEKMNEAFAGMEVEMLREVTADDARIVNVQALEVSDPVTLPIGVGATQQVKVPR